MFKKRHSKLPQIINSPRNDAIILFFSSTGVRPESLIDLKLKHYKQMDDDCANVLIYDNDPEEYPVFLTPESNTSLKKYLEYREENDEKLNQESPLFRNDFRKKMAWFRIKPLASIMLIKLMRKISIKSNLRTNLENGEKRLIKHSMAHLENGLKLL